MNPFYTDYAEYLKRFFPDFKVQKISVNAGFSCPNRDGTIGKGGCIYCDNSSFTPSYCFSTHDVARQLEAGKSFFGRKYPEMKYLAYFQSYTNTATADIQRLEALYAQALEVEDVVGLIIGTRPDCVPDEIADLIGRINRRRMVFVELGAESSHDDTLALINRGHLWEDTVAAVNRLASRGISVGLHLICGLPGEDEVRILETVRRAVELPVESLKFHHLQVLSGTELERRWKAGELEVKPFSAENYIELCRKIINLVPRRIAIERFLASSPPAKVVAPKWGLKNYEFTHRLLRELERGLNQG